MLIEFFPIILFSNTNGKSQPDFTTYSSTGKPELVNKFSGQFSYSVPVLKVPGPSGSGYEIALNYNSGASPNEQASWVGHGWNFSPGAITRQLKGFPDDYKDIDVKYWKKFRPNLTVTRTSSARKEIYSQDSKVKNKDVNISLNQTNIYNNQRGYKTDFGLGVGVYGFGSVNASVSNNGDFSFKYNISLSEVLGAYSDAMKPSKNLFANTLRSTIMKQFSSVYSVVNLSTFIIPNNGIGQFPSIATEFTGGSFSISPAIAYKDGYESYEIEPLTYTQNEQFPVEEQPRIYRAFGYMYTGDVNSREAIMDYYTEKETAFDTRDNYLPIPFNNADNFIVSVQGLSGGFRAWQRKFGTYRPNYIHSETNNNKWGLSGKFGKSKQLNPVLGGGAEYGGGGAEAYTESWLKDEKYKFIPFESNSKLPSVFFRFHNDLGNNQSYFSNKSIDDEHTATSMQLDSENILNGGTNNFKNNLSDRDEYIEQSSFIDFNRYKDNRGSPEYLIEKSFNKNNIREGFEGIDENSISEIKIVNNNGQKYIFGLPVYSRNQKNISFGMLGNFKKNKTDNGNPWHTNDNQRVFREISTEAVGSESGEPDIIMGNEINEPFTNSFLITEIYSADYVDLTNNGPTNDDLGSYTLFEYDKTNISTEKLTSGKENWYLSRQPYTGFNYNRNSISDPNDDMASYSSVEKEIYYLKSIRTKTHLAFFVNNKSNYDIYLEGVTKEIVGSGSERFDGFEANTDDDGGKAGKGDPSNLNGANKLKKLERIELFKLNEHEPIKDEKYNLTKKLQTTYLLHDYSLWPGQENSRSSKGVLTLKEVWTEYNDINSDRNSPYKFYYVPHREEYTDGIVNYNDISTQFLFEPNYNYQDIDAWGNYRPNNLKKEQSSDPNRKQYMLNWVDQNPTNNFIEPTIGQYFKYDPSAWQLKKIITPSDGEIHIDYEENQYVNIHDRPAMTMIRIKKDGFNSETGVLKIDIEKDLNLKAEDDNEKIDKLANFIKDYYVGTEKKMYFKFLYLLGNSEKYNNLSRENNEYIKGYAKVKDVKVNSEHEIEIKFEGNEFIPQKMCKEYYYANRYGKINLVFEPDVVNPLFVEEDITVNIEKETIGGQFLNIFAVTSVGLGSVASLFNEELSYLRVPLPNIIPKKGGGLRVKRILFLDNFDKKVNNSNNVRIYGTEYVYETKDGICSGVATNEPVLIREENSLIETFKKRDSESEGTNIDWDGGLVIAGDDIKQFEGPLGESILPSPSVGYSRIISKNIFSYSTNPGFSIDEFYTCKDFPFDGTPKDANESKFAASINANKYLLPTKSITTTKLKTDKTYYVRLPTKSQSLFSFLTTKARMTQGFQFIINNMHGKPKMSAVYGGNYDFGYDSWNLGSKTEYDYFNIGEKIPVVDENFNINYSYLGRDFEIISESKHNYDKNTFGHGEFDIAFEWKVGPTPPVPAPMLEEIGVGGGVSVSENSIKTATTTKIFNYPAILKRVTTYTDNAYSTLENIGFDKYTGSPIYKRINNKFANKKNEITNDLAYRTLDIPASYVYDEMAPKSKELIGNYSMVNWGNVGLYRKILDDGNERKYLVEFENIWDAVSNEKYNEFFTPGSIIKITAANSKNLIDSYEEIYRIKQVFNDYLTLIPLYDDIAVSDEFEESLINNVMRVNVEVLQPGRTNQLSTIISSLVFDKANPSNTNKIFNETDQTQLDINLMNNRRLIADAINNTLSEIINGNGSTLGWNNSFNGSIEMNNYFASELTKYHNEDVDCKKNSFQLTEHKEDIPVIFNIDPANEGIEYLDKNGEIKSFNTKEELNGKFFIRDFKLRFDKNGTDEFSKYIFPKIINFEFKLVYKRGEDVDLSGIGNGNEYKHPLSEDLNNLIYNAWNTDISKLLKAYNLLPEPDGNNIKEINNSIVDKDQTILDKIYEKLGVKEFYDKKYIIENPYASGFGYDAENPVVIKDILDEEQDKFTHQISGGKLFDVEKPEKFNIYYSNKKAYLGKFLLSNSKGWNDVCHNGEEKGYYDWFGDLDLDGVLENFSIGFEYIDNGSSINLQLIIQNDHFELLDMDIKDLTDYLYFSVIGNNNNNNNNEAYLNYNYNYMGANNTLEKMELTSKIDMFPIDTLKNESVYNLSWRLPQEQNSTGDPGLEWRIASASNSQLNLNPFVIKDGQLMFNPDKLFFGSEVSFDGVQNYEDYDGDDENDPLNNKLIWYDSYAGGEMKYLGIHFYPEKTTLYTADDVLSVSVSELTDNWNKDKIIENITSVNDLDKYRTGEKGLWRLKSSYNYDNRISNASNWIYDNSPTPKLVSNYNTKDKTGKISFYQQNNKHEENKYNEFILYRWDNEEVNSNIHWIKQNQINSYDKNGNAVEQENILGTKSSILFDKNRIWPTLSVQNASSNEVFFNSYEEEEAHTFSDFAHSGIYCRVITEDETIIESKINLDDSKEYLIQFWMYLGNNETISISPLRIEFANPSFQPINIGESQLSILTRVGQWVQLETSFTPTNSGEYDFLIINTNLNEEFYYDDLRIFPSQAVIESFVYDKNQGNLLASLDNDNYALFYHYDAQNRLIRKSKETYKGVKNIAESFYNIPKDEIDYEYFKFEIEGNNHLPSKIENNTLYKKNGLEDKMNINESPNRIIKYDNPYDKKKKLIDPSKINLKQNILDIQFDKNGFRMKTLDIEIDSLKSKIESMKKYFNTDSLFNSKKYKIDYLNAEIELEEGYEKFKQKLKSEYNSVKNSNINLDASKLDSLKKLNNMPDSIRYKEFLKKEGSDIIQRNSKKTIKYNK